MKKISILFLFFFWWANHSFAQKLSLSIYGGANINYSTEQHSKLLQFRVHSAIGAQYGLGLTYKPFKKYPITISGGAEIFHGTNEYHVSYKNFPLLAVGDESVSFKINYSATSYNFNVGYTIYQKNKLNAQFKVGLNAMYLNPVLYNFANRKEKEGIAIINSKLNGEQKFNYIFRPDYIDSYTLAPNTRLNLSYNLTKRINLFCDTGFQFGILRPLFSTIFITDMNVNNSNSNPYAFFITSKGDAITFNMGVTYKLLE